MGLYQNLQDIINVLYTDEELLRLIYYSPANLSTKTPDPLDSSLVNIMDMDEEEQWKIRNERICFSSKTSDIPVDEPFCRIYVYTGRRIPNNGNYLFATQELVIDILCHSDFENGDLRTLRISDRLNELFCQEQVTGLWKMDFVGAGQRSAPNEYTGYQVVYKFDTFKK
jgi:hypothetical protein